MICKVICFPSNEERFIVTGEWIEKNTDFSITSLNEVYIVPKELDIAWKLTTKRLLNLEIIE